MSSDPGTVAEADWTRFGWEAQQAELRSIAGHAASLQLWTVVGAVHRLTTPHRPHNSLYVIDTHGRVVTRWRRTARGDLYATAAASEDPRTSRDSF